MGYFDIIVPNMEVAELTEERIEQFITDLADKEKSDEPDSNIIESKIKGLGTYMSSRNVRDRIYQLALDYHMWMESIGYDNLKMETQRRQCRKFSKHYIYRSKIKTDLEYIPSLRNDWKQFLKYTSQKAEYSKRGMDFVAKNETYYTVKTWKMETKQSLEKTSNFEKMARAK